MKRSKQWMGWLAGAALVTGMCSDVSAWENGKTTINGLEYTVYSDGKADVAEFAGRGDPTLFIPMNIAFSNDIYLVKHILDDSWGHGIFESESFESVTIMANLTGDWYEGRTSPFSVRTNPFCGATIGKLVLGDQMTKIGDYLFHHADIHNAVTIPDGVRNIGEHAFSYSGMPSVVIGNGVTNIGVSAFNKCANLSSVIFGNNVETIGGGAFGGCGALTNIAIPDSVTSIGGAAFTNCISLTSLTIPDRVTNIGDYAFDECRGLTNLVIGCSVTNIGDYAFYDCGGLTSVTIPDSVASIGYNAFGWCTNVTSIVAGNGLTSLVYLPIYDGLTNIVIGHSVTNIAKEAFKRCGLLTRVTIPDSVVNIGQSAFYQCSGLANLHIGNGVTNIGSSAFYRCTNLTSVVIPDSVANIGDGAFYNCGGLTNLAIGNSVTNIGGNALFGCTNLTSVAIPDSVVNIGDGAFYNCGGLTNLAIGNSVTNIGGNAFYGGGKLTRVAIPDSVASIGHNAFYGCSNLTSLAIPDSVKSVGVYAFAGCSGLTNVTIGSGVTSIECDAFSGCTNLTAVHIHDLGAWCGIEFNPLSRSNPLFYAHRLYLNGEEVTGDLLIPDGVARIGVNVFRGCTGLTSVAIGNSVTNIGSYAFAGCSGLTNVVIPDSVASIGEGAFSRCSDTVFDTTSIPGLRLMDGWVVGWTNWMPCNPDFTGVRGFADRAFYACTNLTSVTVPGNVAEIGEGVFAGCSSLTNLLVSDSVARIKDYAFNACSNVTSITTGNGLTSLAGLPIQDSRAHLQNIAFGNGVTDIGERVFMACTNLTDVKIGNNVTNIGNYAFYNCRRLAYMRIPDSVASVGIYAFYGCSGLTSVKIGNGVRNIGDYAFRGCSGLTSLTLSDSVTGIGTLAFYESGLEKLYVPASWEGTAMLENAGVPEGCTVVYGGRQETVTVAFDAHGGSCAPADGEYTAGEPYGELPEAVRAGYTFAGWWTAETGGTRVGADTVADAATTTLHARWTANTYTVTLDRQGGSGGTASVLATYGNELPGIGVPSLAGCVFGGYYSRAGGTGTPYYGADGQGTRTWDVAGDATLYAKWTEITHTQSVAGVKWFYAVSDGTAKVTGANPAEGRLEIPSKLGGYPVTDIGDRAFAGCVELTGVGIPGSVTNIGSGAFDCCGLTEVTIPDSVKCIGDEAFYYCEEMTNVVIGAGVAVIGAGAFEYCAALVAVTIPDGVTDLGARLFEGCRGLASVTIGNGVKTIPDFAFGTCTALTNVVIGNSVTHIGYAAFAGCWELEVLVVPCNVESVVGAFEYSLLKGLYVPAAWKGTDMLQNAMVPYGCAVVYGLSATVFTVPAGGVAAVSVPYANPVGADGSFKFGETGIAAGLPVGSAVYFWDEVQQKWGGGMKSAFGWDPAESNRVLLPGEGFCVRNGGTEAIEVAAAGEIPSDESLVRAYRGGGEWTFVAVPYPCGEVIQFGDTELARQLGQGATVMFWDASAQGWNSYSKTAKGWNSTGASRVLGEGEAFFVRSAPDDGDGTWEAVKPCDYP